MSLIDTAQIDGYAPDVRMIETVTKGDLQSGSITIGDCTIVPWMSVPGWRYWKSCNRLYRMWHPQLYI